MRWLVRTIKGAWTKISVYFTKCKTWKQAKKRIKRRVREGDDINTGGSKYRIVTCACDNGFVVPKGDSFYVLVTWEMLEKCWRELVRTGEYSRKVIVQFYQKEVDDAGCLVHIVGKIFEKAGLVYSDANDKYYDLK